MSDPINKLVTGIASEVDYRLRRDFENAVFCDSPIEKYLYLSIVALCMDAFRVKTSVHVLKSESEKSEDFAGCVQVVPQAAIGKYRVDFVFLRFLNGSWSKLVVECDGHDFHEKTREQVARDKERDRFVQDAGYQIYRYSGSEIYKDPYVAASQIMHWTLGANHHASMQALAKDGKSV